MARSYRGSVPRLPAAVPAADAVGHPAADAVGHPATGAVATAVGDSRPFDRVVPVDKTRPGEHDDVPGPARLAS
ncbi:MAG: hypothetical protein ABSF33_11225 [Acidimicrobiales bacterium]